MQALAAAFLSLLLVSSSNGDSGPSDYSLLDATRAGENILKFGQSGAVIFALQNALAGVTFAIPGNLTGIFDDDTLASVNAFQESVHLSAEGGVVGTKTMAAFDIALGLDSSPSQCLHRLKQSEVLKRGALFFFLKKRSRLLLLLVLGRLLS